MAAVGVSNDVLEFVVDLVKCPDSWLEFPVLVSDSGTNGMWYFDLSNMLLVMLAGKINWIDFLQILYSFREKIKGASNKMPIRSPSFPSVISDNEIRSQPDESQAWENLIAIRTRSQQSIDQFSEVPSIIDAYSDDTNMVRAELGSTTGIDDGSVVMEKYMDALLTDLGETNSPRLRHLSAGNKNEASQGTSGEKMFYFDESGVHEKIFSEESGDWHPVEDSDFEVVDGP